MSNHRANGRNIIVKEVNTLPMTERLGNISINTSSCGTWKRPLRSQSGEFSGCRRIELKRWKKY